MARACDVTLMWLLVFWFACSFSYSNAVYTHGPKKFQNKRDDPPSNHYWTSPSYRTKSRFYIKSHDPEDEVEIWIHYESPKGSGKWMESRHKGEWDLNGDYKPFDIYLSSSYKPFFIPADTKFRLRFECWNEHNLEGACDITYKVDFWKCACPDHHVRTKGCDIGIDRECKNCDFNTQKYESQLDNRWAGLIEPMEFCIVCPYNKEGTSRFDTTQNRVINTGCGKCSDHFDPASYPSCNRCKPNFAGDKCDRCSSGFNPISWDNTCSTCLSVFNQTADPLCKVCNAGYFLTANREHCLQCPPGTFWEDGSCLDCPNQTYNPIAGGISESVCRKCPAGHAPSRDKSKCVLCPAGTTSDGSECTSCSVSKNSAGESVCLDAFWTKSPVFLSNATVVANVFSEDTKKSSFLRLCVLPPCPCGQIRDPKSGDCTMAPDEDTLLETLALIARCGKVPHEYLESLTSEAASHFKLAKKAAPMESELYQGSWGCIEKYTPTECPLSYVVAANFIGGEARQCPCHTRARALSPNELPNPELKSFNISLDDLSDFVTIECIPVTEEMSYFAHLVKTVLCSRSDWEDEQDADDLISVDLELQGRSVPSELSRILTTCWTDTFGGPDSKSWGHGSSAGGPARQAIAELLSGWLEKSPLIYAVETAVATGFRYALEVIKLHGPGLSNFFAFPAVSEGHDHFLSVNLPVNIHMPRICYSPCNCGQIRKVDVNGQPGLCVREDAVNILVETYAAYGRCTLLSDQAYFSLAIVPRQVFLSRALYCLRALSAQEDPSAQFTAVDELVQIIQVQQVSSPDAATSGGLGGLYSSAAAYMRALNKGGLRPTLVVPPYGVAFYTKKLDALAGNSGLLMQVQAKLERKQYFETLQNELGVAVNNIQGDFATNAGMLADLIANGTKSTLQAFHEDARASVSLAQEEEEMFFKQFKRLLAIGMDAFQRVWGQQTSLETAFEVLAEASYAMIEIKRQIQELQATITAVKKEAMKRLFRLVKDLVIGAVSVALMAVPGAGILAVAALGASIGADAALDEAMSEPNVDYYSDYYDAEGATQEKAGKSGEGRRLADPPLQTKSPTQSPTQSPTRSPTKGPTGPTIPPDKVPNYTGSNEKPNSLGLGCW